MSEKTFFNPKNGQQVCFQCKIDQVNCSGEGPCKRCRESHKRGDNGPKYKCVYIAVGTYYKDYETPKSREEVVKQGGDLCIKASETWRSKEFKPAELRKKAEKIQRSRKKASKTEEYDPMRELESVFISGEIYDASKFRPSF